MVRASSSITALSTRPASMARSTSLRLTCFIDEPFGRARKMISEIARHARYAWRNPRRTRPPKYVRLIVVVRPAQGGPAPERQRGRRETWS
jgi:hypothetical protein